MRKGLEDDGPSGAGTGTLARHKERTDEHRRGSSFHDSLGRPRAVSHTSTRWSAASLQAVGGEGSCENKRIMVLAECDVNLNVFTYWLL